MIAYLKGKIIELDFTSMTILTSGGVGYEIGINEKIYSKLAIDEETHIYVYHHITENNQTLFGFLDSGEKKVFTELIKISGIGGKVAMQILSLSIERLIQAVKLEDKKTIESIKGIGKKMAEKIILELKDKDFGIVVSDDKKENAGQKLSKGLYDSIKATLTNMGYNPRDIDKILLELPEGMEDAGDILPFVIKELS